MKKEEIRERLCSLMALRSDTPAYQAKFAEEAYEKFLKPLSPGLITGKRVIPGDPDGRSVLWALLLGQGKKTIVLQHHHDTVDSFDYGDLEELSRKPKELHQAFAERAMREEVRKDLESGDWLFGRGSADMKAGMAIHMALMKHFDEVGLSGSLLFLSVPDEETMSRGMLESLPLMEELQEKYGLQYDLMIDSESHRGNDRIPNIYSGSVGKIAIVTYVRGVKSHIGNIEDGFNPLSVLSRLILKTEFQAELADSTEEEISVPPSWSFARDFKEVYNASIPESAGGYVSFLTFRRSPSEVLDIFRKLSIEALQETIEEHRRQFDILGIEPRQEFEVHVKSYGELYQDALAKDEKATLALKEAFFQKLPELLEEVSLPESNFILIDELMNLVDYHKPTVVYGITAPYYPHVSNRDMGGGEELMQDLREVAAGLYDDINEIRFYLGISDLSYVGLPNADDGEQVAANLPLWHEDFYHIDFEAMKRLHMPVLNIGPWGKDLHQFTERVYMPDVVERIPELLRRFILKRMQ